MENTFFFFKKKKKKFKIKIFFRINIIKELIIIFNEQKIFINFFYLLIILNRNRNRNYKW